MRRTLTAVGLGLAMTSVLAGCGDDEPGDAAEETSETASTDASDSASGSPSAEESSASADPTGSTAPVVTVVDAGEAPGQLLELELEEGHHETSVMRMTQEMTVSGMPSQKMPPVSFTLSNAVVEATDEGYVVETAYEDLAVDGSGHPRELVQSLEEALSVLEGLSGSMTVGRDGGVTETDIDIPADADPMMASMLEQLTSQAGSMTVPLPDEPVGPGAVWKARSALELSGVTSALETTYTLEAIEGDEVELTLVQDQVIQPDTVAGAEIVSGSGSTQGTTTLSLSQVLPVQAIAEGTTEMVMEAMGQEMTMDMVIDMELTTTVD